MGYFYKLLEIQKQMKEYKARKLSGGNWAQSPNGGSFSCEGSWPVRNWASLQTCTLPQDGGHGDRGLLPSTQSCVQMFYSYVTTLMHVHMCKTRDTHTHTHTHTKTFLLNPGRELSWGEETKELSNMVCILVVGNGQHISPVRVIYHRAKPLLARKRHFYDDILSQPC